MKEGVTMSWFYEEETDYESAICYDYECGGDECSGCEFAGVNCKNQCEEVTIIYPRYFPWE